jgi:hypothetical protein
MRSDVDIQAASAMGAIVWSFDGDSGGNDGVQQFTEIAGRTGDAAGSVSVGGDGHGAEWSDFQREPGPERVALAEEFVEIAGDGD